jgi:pimeloyl-ACP methyl ester carboxylesterase
MAEAVVRGVRLYYEVVGSVGPWIAFTPGSRRASSELRNLASLVSAEGFRVLLHDRRNCGASEVAIEPLGSEHEIWADDLALLAKHVGAESLYVGGSSAGARLAILFALRHPSMVNGLLLWRLTGGGHAATKLAELYYGDFIKLAQAGGMRTVCESDHFAACIKARPSNRQRLMNMSVEEFVNIMETWRTKFLEAANLPMIGATEDELRSISAPVCLIMGNDVIHTPATARKFAQLVGQTQLHEGVVEKRLDDDLLAEWDQAEWIRAEPAMANIFIEFLSRHRRRLGFG